VLCVRRTGRHGLRRMTRSRLLLASSRAFSENEIGASEWWVGGW
jgi:hypothetical protein